MIIFRNIYCAKSDIYYICVHTMNNWIKFIETMLQCYFQARCDGKLMVQSWSLKPSQCENFCFRSQKTNQDVMILGLNNVI